MNKTRLLIAALAIVGVAGAANAATSPSTTAPAAMHKVLVKPVTSAEVLMKKHKKHKAHAKHAMIVKKAPAKAKAI